MARTGMALACAAALAVCAAPLSAHHGSAAYDPDHVVSVTGTVTAFEFSNPHVLVYFEAKTDKGGADPWQGELTSPNRLGRVGWTKRTLKPGDSITVTGMAAKSGKHSLWIQKIIGPDGEPLPTASDTDR
jgi:hypothetical protein